MSLPVKVVLEGTQSTGKSELAPVLAGLFDVPFFPSPVRGVHERCGTRPGYPGADDFLKAGVQNRILSEVYCRILNGPPGVYDRGPASVYAYSLVELSRSTEPAAATTLTACRNACQTLARAPDVLTLYLPPDIPAAADGVRQEFPFLREQVHLLLSGILKSGRFHVRDVHATAKPERLIEAANCLAAYGGVPVCGPSYARVKEQYPEYFAG